MNAILETPPQQQCSKTNPMDNVLMGKSLQELQELVVEMGEPKFRADQLHNWIYVRCERDFEKMTNLKKEFRQKIADQFEIGSLTIQEKQVSDDGTIKYLFKLYDGSVVESVLMYFEERETYAICISSQVGCAVNCSFCATGKLGFKRDLTASEIVEQYVYVPYTLEVSGQIIGHFDAITSKTNGRFQHFRQAHGAVLLDNMRQSCH